MYCTKCGFELDALAAYCSQCGAPTGRRVAAAGMEPPPRLTRALYDSKIAGVCGGLARYLDVDPTFVRLIWLIVTICFPPFLLGYFVAWIIVPLEKETNAYGFGAGVPNPQSQV